MKKLVTALFCLVVFCLFSAASNAQTVSSNAPEFRLPAGYKPAKLENPPALQTMLDRAVAETLEKFKDKNLKLIALTDVSSELAAKEAEAWQKLLRVLTHEISNSAIPLST